MTDTADRQPVLAKRARINPHAGVFEIDGEPFPYWLAETATVELGAGEATTLVLRVPLEYGVTIDNALQPSSAEVEAHTEASA